MYHCLCRRNRAFCGAATGDMFNAVYDWANAMHNRSSATYLSKFNAAYGRFWSYMGQTWQHDDRFST